MVKLVSMGKATTLIKLSGNCWARYFLVIIGIIFASIFKKESNMRQKGFTLLELMIVVTLIAILAAIAVPSYMQYATRARVTEGFNLAAPAKVAVADVVNATSSLPTTQKDTMFTSPPSTVNVSSVVIGSDGLITITYTELAGGGTIILKPTLQSNGILSWDCTGGTLAAKYRPAICR